MLRACYGHACVRTKSSEQRTIFEKRTSSVPIFVLVNRELRLSSDYDSIPVAIPAAAPTVIPWGMYQKSAVALHFHRRDVNQLSLVHLTLRNLGWSARIKLSEKKEEKRKKRVEIIKSVKAIGRIGVCQIICILYWCMKKGRSGK